MDTEEQSLCNYITLSIRLICIGIYTALPIPTTVMATLSAGMTFDLILVSAACTLTLVSAAP